MLGVNHKVIRIGHKVAICGGDFGLVAEHQLHGHAVGAALIDDEGFLVGALRGVAIDILELDFAKITTLLAEAVVRLGGLHGIIALPNLGVGESLSGSHGRGGGLRRLVRIRLGVKGERVGRLLRLFRHLLRHLRLLFGLTFLHLRGLIEAEA